MFNYKTVSLKTVSLYIDLQFIKNAFLIIFPDRKYTEIKESTEKFWNHSMNCNEKVTLQIVDNWHPQPPFCNFKNLIVAEILIGKWCSS